MHVIHDDACVKLQTKEQNPSDFLLSLISLYTSSKHGSVFFFFPFKVKEKCRHVENNAALAGVVSVYTYSTNRPFLLSQIEFT